MHVLQYEVSDRTQPLYTQSIQWSYHWSSCHTMYTILLHYILTYISMYTILLHYILTYISMYTILLHYILTYIGTYTHTYHVNLLLWRGTSSYLLSPSSFYIKGALSVEENTMYILVCLQMFHKNLHTITYSAYVHEYIHILVSQCEVRSKAPLCVYIL